MTLGRLPLKQLIVRITRAFPALRRLISNIRQLVKSPTLMSFPLIARGPTKQRLNLKTQALNMNTLKNTLRQKKSRT